MIFVRFHGSRPSGCGLRSVYVSFFKHLSHKTGFGIALGDKTFLGPHWGKIG